MVFSSFPDFSDNCKALFYSMIEEDIEAKYVWLYSDLSRISTFSNQLEFFGIDNITFVKKNTLRGIFHYLTASFIFTTHGMFEQIPILPWQKKINLWHGMPLKTIGSLLPNGKKNKLQLSYTISNGFLFNETICQAFSVKNKKILKIGSPRNDMLFRQTDFSFQKIFGNKFPTIMWLPTYRKSRVGNIMNDGKFDPQEIGSLMFSDLEVLNKYCKSIKKNVLIKLHPMDILSENRLLIKKINQLENIKLITSQDVIFDSYDLYEILSKTDGLITDYSSVYFDYILLKKPIGIFADDKVEYKKNRGLIPEIQKYYTGYNINNLKDLKKFLILSSEENDKLQKNLSKARKVFQTYDAGGKNSVLLLKMINLI
ncbi:CDP-glycerol glycerophosphotransferase family protein [Enterococcus dispar]|uniref:CDP-glycerol glycerophosphotransferase family protein n=1 Tax=Enterococcus dispar TaxID=44009 RepID=UPI002B4BA049|nr:CDP-glycerol glycerophosphotransferase family protein [Enterococcus dispar]